MKKLTKIRLGLTLNLLSLFFLSEAQNAWTRMTNFPGPARDNVVSFTIGHYAFVGLGNNGSGTCRDFYKWDQTTNTWTRIPDYPGGGQIGAIAFSANGKGFVGLGEDAAQTKYTDLYQYDTLSNSWTPRTNFPAAGRYSSSCFVIGLKAVMICGSFGSSYTNESWTYDILADSWSQNATPYPGGNLEGLCSFNIGPNGYAGGGWDHSVVNNNFWKYSIATDTWTSIPNFPVAVGISEVSNAFVIGSKAYVCTGLKDVLTFANSLPTGYAYDTLSNSWSAFTNMAANHIEHSFCAEFALGNYGYICSGSDSSGAYVRDLFQYGPRDTACHDWTQMAIFPGVARTNLVNFTIGHYAFVGLGNNGSTGYKDFYKWDQTTNVWTRIPDYPGSGEIGPIAFSANGKGYVGLGEDGLQNKYTDLYEYDTLSNAWTAKAIFPGTARYAASCFVVGQKSIMFCGSFGSSYTNESWTYDIAANSWSQNANPYPGGNLEGLCTFSIGNTGYGGGGWNHSVVNNNFWKYSVSTDNWTTIPNFPVAVGISEVTNAFVIGSKGYVCTGLKDVLIPSNTLPTGYAYDTLSNSWSAFTNMSSSHIEHAYSAEFALGNYGYICSGQDSTGTVIDDFWQYYPCSPNMPLGTANLEPSTVGLQVSPNPSDGHFILTCALPAGASTVTVVNLLGQTVYSQPVLPGTQRLTIDLPESLGSGIYYVCIQSENARNSRKIILNR